MSIINDPFTWIAGELIKWLNGFMPPEAVNVTMMAVRATVLGVFALLMFMVMTWIERKGIARIQNRLGPNLAGPWGLFQPLADGVKALTKEDTVPDGADLLSYNIAPVLVAVAAIAVFAVIPFGPGLIGADMNIGIFFFLAIGALGILGILVAGWGSNNKYALLGAFRVVAQLVSYEVPQVLAIVAVVMLTGSMSMLTIVDKQPIWFVFVLPISALISLFSGMAEIGRSPFDLLDAESEIIAGHHIEYSGMKFALFFLAEYVHAFAVSCIIAVLFLGGWGAPSPLVSFMGVALVLVLLLFVNSTSASSQAGDRPAYSGVILVAAILGVLLVVFSILAAFGLTLPWLWFLVKAVLVFNVMVWARGTLPRLRIDHLMAFNWKFLVPLSLANVVVVAMADRLAQALGLTSGSWPWAWVMLAFNVALLLASFVLVGAVGRRVRLAEQAPTAPVADMHEDHAAVGAH